MAIKDKISIDQIEQRIDLKELFGRDPSPVESRAFQERAVNAIIERTQDGKKRGGGNFTQYSEEYAELKGVSRSDVDLTLMGDMLLSIDAKTDGSEVVLFIDDDLQKKKAFNHQTGDTLPARPFFGLELKEAQDIAREVKSSEPSIVDQIAIPSLFQQESDIDIDSILRNIGLFVD